MVFDCRRAGRRCHRAPMRRAPTPPKAGTTPAASHRLASPLRVDGDQQVPAGGHRVYPGELPGGPGQSRPHLIGIIGHLQRRTRLALRAARLAPVFLRRDFGTGLPSPCWRAASRSSARLPQPGSQVPLPPPTAPLPAPAARPAAPDARFAAPRSQCPSPRPPAATANKGISFYMLSALYCSRLYCLAIGFHVPRKKLLSLVDV